MNLMTAPKTDRVALEKLTRARSNLIIEQPFFGSLALRLHLVEDISVPTLAVDGKHIFYNPEFIRTLEPHLVKSAVGHEVGHCVFSHIHRRGTRDPRKWNVAGDYVVNEMLKDAGFQLDESWLYDAAYAGMTADHIYSLLPESGGNGGLCDVRQAPGDAATEERDWKVATIQAANAAKMAGRLPKALERFIDGMFDAQVDWRTLLRRFITQTSDADYTWARPNRRMLAHGHYLPKLWSEQMGEMVVAVDTSGSIDQPTLSAFGAEIAAIVQDVRPSKIHIIYCDAAVNRVDEFTADDEIVLKAVGGGGTHFAPPFLHLEQHGIEPVCVVYLTDLIGDFGPEPAYPVLWVCTTDRVAPWGETIPIEI